MRDPTHLVFGVAPDGGRLTGSQRADLLQAIELGLHVVADLHDFLADDPQLAAAARRRGVTLIDARKRRDSFPGYPLHPIERQIEAIELISERPVIALACDPLVDVEPLVRALRPWLERQEEAV